MLRQFMCARSQLQLAQSLGLLLGAYAFRHIDVRGDNLDKLSLRRERGVAYGFEMFNRPVGKDNSELDRVLSLLEQRLPDLAVHPVAIVWMDPLPDSFAVGETLQRVKPPFGASSTNESPSRVIDRGARVAQSLGFSQISFAASERLLRALPLR